MPVIGNLSAGSSSTHWLAANSAVQTTSMLITLNSPDFALARCTMASRCWSALSLSSMSVTFSLGF